MHLGEFKVLHTVVNTTDANHLLVKQQQTFQGDEKTNSFEQMPLGSCEI